MRRKDLRSEWNIHFDRLRLDYYFAFIVFRLMGSTSWCLVSLVMRRISADAPYIPHLEGMLSERTGLKRVVKYCLMFVCLLSFFAGDSSV